VGGRSVRSEPLRVDIGTARSFEVECALNAKEADNLTVRGIWQGA
jgi:hypothetical protein